MIHTVWTSCSPSPKADRVAQPGAGEMPFTVHLQGPEFGSQHHITSQACCTCVTSMLHTCDPALEVGRQDCQGLQAVSPAETLSSGEVQGRVRKGQPTAPSAAVCVHTNRNLASTGVERSQHHLVDHTTPPHTQREANFSPTLSDSWEQRLWEFSWQKPRNYSGGGGGGTAYTFLSRIIPLTLASISSGDFTSYRWSKFPYFTELKIELINTILFYFNLKSPCSHIWLL